LNLFDFIFELIELFFKENSSKTL